jgi:hypothetical protein
VGLYEFLKCDDGLGAVALGPVHAGQQHQGLRVRLVLLEHGSATLTNSRTVFSLVRSFSQLQ